MKIVFVTSYFMGWALAQAPTSGVNIDWLSRATATAILAFGVIAFMREWIVPGPVYKRSVAERDRMFGILVQAQDSTEKTIEVAAKKAV